MKKSRFWMGAIGGLVNFASVFAEGPFMDIPAAPHSEQPVLCVELVTTPPTIEFPSDSQRAIADYWTLLRWGIDSQIFDASNVFEFESIPELRRPRSTENETARLYLRRLSEFHLGVTQIDALERHRSDSWRTATFEYPRLQDPIRSLSRIPYNEPFFPQGGRLFRGFQLLRETNQQKNGLNQFIILKFGARPVRRHLLLPSRPIASAVSSRGKQLAWLDSTGSVFVFDLQEWKLKGAHPEHPKSSNLVWSSRGSVLNLITPNGENFQWDLE